MKKPKRWDSHLDCAMVLGNASGRVRDDNQKTKSAGNLFMKLAWAEAPIRDGMDASPCCAWKNSNLEER